jgi:hypothetical protein
MRLKGAPFGIEKLTALGTLFMEIETERFSAMSIFVRR